MPLAGRCAMVVHMAMVPDRAAGRTGRPFYRNRPRWGAVWAAGVLAAVTWSVLGRRGMVVFAACIVLTLAGPLMPSARSGEPRAIRSARSVRSSRRSRRSLALGAVQP